MLLTIKGLLTRGRPIANAEERNQHESNSNSHNPPSIPSAAAAAAATAISTLQSDKCVSKGSSKFRFASIPPEVVLGGISNQPPPPPPLPSWGNKNTPKTTTKKKYRISMRDFLKSDDYDHDNDNEEEEEEERGSVIWVQRIVPSPPPLLPTELPIYEMNMSAKYQLARRPAVRRRSNSPLGLQSNPLPSLINPGHRALELLGQLSSDGGSTDNTDQNDVDSGRMRRRSSSRERDLSGLPPLESHKTTTTTMQDSSFGREPEAVDPRPPLVDTTATSTSFAPPLSPFPCMAATSSSSSGEHDEDDDEKLMDTILDTKIEESSPQQQQQQTAEPQVYIRLWKDVIVRQEKKDAARIFGSSSCGKRVAGVAAGMGNRG